MSYFGCITSDPQPPSRLWCLCVQSVEEFYQSVRSPAVPWCKHVEMTQQQEEVTCSPSIKASLCKWREVGGGGDAKAGTRSRVEETSWRWHDGMMSSSAPHRAPSSHIKQPIKSPGLWDMHGAISVVTLLWTLHCVDFGNGCFKVSSWLKSSIICFLLGQRTCERAVGKGKTNRKQVLPLVFVSRLTKVK